jgi:hypothetical protein
VSDRLLGRELNAKEKLIHTQGLVGVLKDLHDDLDAAVLQAYGWTDLNAGAPDTPVLLTRLVALNARRAAEEKTGTVRWLRPAFQNPALSSATNLLSKDELSVQVLSGLQADLALDNPLQPVKPRKATSATTGTAPRPGLPPCPIKCAPWQPCWSAPAQHCRWTR